MEINGERGIVPVDAERSIVPVDAERISGGDHSQGSIAADVINGSTIKVGSLCIDLGIVREKGGAQKCRHFSIRDYVSGMRERGGRNCLPFADGSSNYSTEQLPPMEVPSFRYWRCQNCLRGCGAATTLQETTLVSRHGQSVVQPCVISCTSQDCTQAAVLPFGEGTSGLNPIDKRNDNEGIPVVLRGDENQPSPEIPANTMVSEEPTSVGSVEANATVEANAGAPDMEERNVLRDREHAKQDSIVEEAITGPVVQPLQSDHQSDDPSGHPRRKHRKVRLLTELLCGNVKDQQQKKKNSLDLGPNASSPSAPSTQSKRKMPQDQDRRSVDVGKKVKSVKGDAIAKTSEVEHSRDRGAMEGAQNADKYQWNKHATQSSSVLGNASNDPIMAWRSIISETGRADKPVSAANGLSRPTHNLPKGRGTEVYSNVMPPPQPDKKSNASKKIPENPQRSHQIFGEDLWKRKDGGRYGVKDCQSDRELGLGLSLNYNPHVETQVCSPPLMPKRIPSKDQDHGRKGGFFLGESSIGHRLTSDPKSKDGSISEVSEAPRTALLQEQRHYCPQLSQGNFSQHQRLDFSDPHNKRNGGVRGFSDVMRAHNHQRQEAFSSGRADIKEIVELMARNQYERSLCEGGSYYLPGSSNNNGIPNSSGFFKVNSNEGLRMPYQEYPGMRKPSSSISTISMMPTGENTAPITMRSPVGFFHQDRIPAYTMFDAFPQCQQQPPSGIRFSDSGTQRHHNSRYHESNGTQQSSPTNMQVLEAFSKHRSGTQHNQVTGNVWSTVPTTMPIFHNREMNKGKSIMDLDLNVVAPNGLEEQNKNSDFEYFDRTSIEYHPSLTKDNRIEPNPRHMGSLDSSYSNEAIPAMQLLSLMDAGKSNSPYSVEGRKFIGKSYSPSYDYRTSTMTGKPNPNSELRQNAQKPIEFSRRFMSSHGTPPSLPIANPFPSLFQTDRNLKGPTSHGCHVFHKPQQEKPRGSSSASLSRSCRPDDSFIFPLPWHATEDRNGRVNLGAPGAFGPSHGSSGSGVCGINQNPADFSTPGPANVYMINGEDLIVRGKSSYKGKSVMENADGRKRQRVVKSTPEERPQQRTS